MSSTYSTVFFPIFPWILQIAVIVFALAVGLSLASVGEPVNQVVGLSTDTSCKCTGIAASYKVSFLQNKVKKKKQQANILGWR